MWTVPSEMILTPTVITPFTIPFSFPFIPLITPLLLFMWLLLLVTRNLCSTILHRMTSFTAPLTFSSVARASVMKITLISLREMTMIATLSLISYRCLIVAVTTIILLLLLLAVVVGPVSLVVSRRSRRC